MWPCSVSGWLIDWLVAKNTDHLVYMSTSLDVYNLISPPFPLGKPQIFLMAVAIKALPPPPRLSLMAVGTFLL